jgi:hypothetical protein
MAGESPASVAVAVEDVAKLTGDPEGDGAAQALTSGIIRVHQATIVDDERLAPGKLVPAGDRFAGGGRR